MKFPNYFEDVRVDPLHWVHGVWCWMWAEWGWCLSVMGCGLWVVVPVPERLSLSQLVISPPPIHTDTLIRQTTAHPVLLGSYPDIDIIKTILHTVPCPRGEAWVGWDHSLVMFKLHIMIVRRIVTRILSSLTNNKLSVINSGLFSVSIFPFCRS